MPERGRLIQVDPGTDPDSKHGGRGAYWVLRNVLVGPALRRLFRPAELGAAQAPRRSLPSHRQAASGTGGGTQREWGGCFPCGRRETGSPSAMALFADGEQAVEARTHGGGCAASREPAPCSPQAGRVNQPFLGGGWGRVPSAQGHFSQT